MAPMSANGPQEMAGFSLYAISAASLGVAQPLFSSSTTLPVVAPMDNQAFQWPSFSHLPVERSPVSSLSPVSLAEARSEDEECDEYAVGLAEKIAHSTIQEDEDENHTLFAFVSQAPFHCSSQRISTGGLNESECKPGYSLIRQPTASSRSSSTPFRQIKEEAFQLLREEVVRIRLQELRGIERAKRSSLKQRGSLHSHRRLPVPSSENLPSPGAQRPKAWRFKSSQTLKQTDEAYVRANCKHFRSTWSAQVQHQEAMANASLRGGSLRTMASSPYVPSCCSSGHCGVMTWSGMRGLSPGKHSGTGVFLPRRPDYKPDKRKPGSNAANNASDALIPSLIPELSSNEWPALQSDHGCELQEVAPNISLPTEWTY